MPAFQHDSRGKTEGWRLFRVNALGTVPREVVQERPCAEPVGVVRRAAGPVATARLRGPGLVKPTAPREGTRAETLIDRPGLIARSDDAVFLRGLIRDAARRLMDGAAAVGGAARGPQPGAGEPARPLARQALARRSSGRGPRPRQWDTRRIRRGQDRRTSRSCARGGHSRPSRSRADRPGKRRWRWCGRPASTALPPAPLTIRRAPCIARQAIACNRREGSGGHVEEPGGSASRSTRGCRRS